MATAPTAPAKEKLVADFSALIDSMAAVYSAREAVSAAQELQGIALEAQQPSTMQASPASPARSTQELAGELLGGAKVLGRALIHSDEQAHERVLGGIPARALAELMSKVQTLPTEDVLAGLGVSARSLARRKKSPKALLPLDEAGRLWRFAEVLAHATSVFGTQAEAEAWLARPAIGLARQRPIDLLKTPPGARLVSQHLTRLEYGVYT